MKLGVDVDGVVLDIAFLEKGQHVRPHIGMQLIVFLNLVLSHFNDTTVAFHLLSPINEEPAWGTAPPYELILSMGWMSFNVRIILLQRRPLVLRYQR